MSIVRGLVLGVVMGTAAMCVSACAGQPSNISRERIPHQVVAERLDLVVTQLGMTMREPEPELPPSECEPNAKTYCSWPPISLAMPRPGEKPHYLMKTCRQRGNGSWHWDGSACATPLVVAFEENESVTFTKPASTAASFTVGPFEKTEWVSAKTPWLALDTDASGCIENQSELFGPPSDGSGTNGFDKLAKLDTNHDGRIDARDPAFASLVLWSDQNNDRKCSPSEVRRLSDTTIESLDLGYAMTKNIPFGSHEGEHASISLRDGKRGRLIDVYLAPTND